MIQSRASGPCPKCGYERCHYTLVHQSNYPQPLEHHQVHCPGCGYLYSKTLSRGLVVAEFTRSKRILV